MMVIHSSVVKQWTFLHMRQNSIQLQKRHVRHKIQSIVEFFFFLLYMTKTVLGS